MNRLFTWKGIVTAILLGFACISGGTRAVASEGCARSCHYAWVTITATREVPYTKVVIRYDHCGRPYKVAKTCLETVQVAVRKRVLVCD